MRPELSILSFLCTVLLVGLAPLHVQTSNVALVALITWLLLCNLIQAANSIVWSNNTMVRSAVWCDISTKLLLGAHIGLPAACTCISVHLHFLASSRDGRLHRHRTLYELTLCVILPLVYMALQIIVQDYRFSLAEDFGCIPSIYMSAPAIILVWIPPVILCITTFAFAALAIWTHAHRHPLLSDLAGLSPRVITITFLRPLFMASLISMLILSVSIFDIHARVASSDGLLPWVSWAHVHAHISEVHVIEPFERLRLAGIEASWWIIPTASLIFVTAAFIGLVCCVQHDSYSGRSLGKWFRSTMLHRPGGGDTFIQSSSDLASHITVTSPTPPLPVHLKSGWDSSLGTDRGRKLRSKRPSLKCKIPPTPAASSDTDSDASFKASTLTYLESPTGREATGLSSLPSLGSTLAASHNLGAPPESLSLSPPGVELGLSISPTHSILSSPWPRPPSTVPDTPTESVSLHALSPRSPEHHFRSPSEASLTTSLASSTISASAYIPDPDIFLHSVAMSPHRPPFQDAGIPASAPSPSSARRPKRVPSKEMLSARSLTSNVKRVAGRRREQDAMGEAIYMTVVHETQAC